MSLVTHRARTALWSAIGLAALTACTDDAKTLLTGPAPKFSLMRSYVALGNSITAGYQSGGINDSTQRQSYAKLIADQAGTRYAYASIAKPGCPPPVANFLTQARVANAPAATCLFRDPSAVGQQVLNNVAVPGAFVNDPNAVSSVNSSILTTVILGGKTQVRRALEADPSFVSVWIGNNDVLGPATSGLTVARTVTVNTVTPAPAFKVSSPGITSSATFTSTYNAIVDSLRTQPGLQGILIGVVDVTNIPNLFPAAALANPLFLGALQQGSGGRPITVRPNCTGSTSLISIQILSVLGRQAVPTIGCAKEFKAGSTTVQDSVIGDLYVLDAAEQATLQTAITAFNTAISNKATAAGWAYFDPNPALQQLRISGAVPVTPNFANPTQPFGEYFSLDGVHPSAKAHVLIANSLIGAINAKYGTTIPTIQ